MMLSPIFTYWVLSILAKKGWETKQPLAQRIRNRCQRNRSRTRNPGSIVSQIWIKRNEGSGYEEGESIRRIVEKAERSDSGIATVPVVGEPFTTGFDCFC